jgi:hypothetical protein
VFRVCETISIEIYGEGSPSLKLRALCHLARRTVYIYIYIYTDCCGRVRDEDAAGMSPGPPEPSTAHRNRTSTSNIDIEIKRAINIYIYFHNQIAVSCAYLCVANVGIVLAVRLGLRGVAELLAYFIKLRLRRCAVGDETSIRRSCVGMGRGHRPGFLRLYCCAASAFWKIREGQCTSSSAPCNQEGRRDWTRHWV